MSNLLKIYIAVGKRDLWIPDFLDASLILHIVSIIMKVKQYIWKYFFNLLFPSLQSGLVHK